MTLEMFNPDIEHIGQENRVCIIISARSDGDDSYKTDSNFSAIPLFYRLRISFRLEIFRHDLSLDYFYAVAGGRRKALQRRYH